MQSATELLALVNDYLDSIEGSVPGDTGEAKERLRNLKNFITEMRRHNFHAPKFAISSLFGNLALLEKEELIEAMPMLQEFLYSLNLRAWTYERAKIAYLSNKLAAEALESEWLLDYLPYLPYGGNYFAFSEAGGGASVMVFRDVMKVLSGEKRTEVVFDEEKPVSVTEERERGILPRSTATVVASMGVNRAVREHMRSILEDERSVIPQYDRVVEYERIVSRYDLSRVYENPDLLWDLLQELEEKGFLEKDGSVDPEILAAVRKRRYYRYRRLLRYTQSYLTLFFLEYYAYYWPWRERRQPLRGLPRSIARLSPLLGNIELEECKREKRDIVKVFKQLETLSSLFPERRREVAESILHTVCPSRGRPHPDIEEVLGSLGATAERVRKLLEALDDDKDKEKRGHPPGEG